LINKSKLTDIESNIKKENELFTRKSSENSVKIFPDTERSCKEKEKEILSGNNPTTGYGSNQEHTSEQITKAINTFNKFLLKNYNLNNDFLHDNNVSKVKP